MTGLSRHLDQIKSYRQEYQPVGMGIDEIALPTSRAL